MTDAKTFCRFPFQVLSKSISDGVPSPSTGWFFVLLTYYWNDLAARYASEYTCHPRSATRDDSSLSQPLDPGLEQLLAQRQS